MRTKTKNFETVRPMWLTTVIVALILLLAIFAVLISTGHIGVIARRTDSNVTKSIIHYLSIM